VVAKFLSQASFFPSKLERAVSHPPNLLDPEIRLSELLPKKPRPCDKSTAMKKGWTA
jgi:hypothetical protein